MTIFDTLPPAPAPDPALTAVLADVQRRLDVLEATPPDARLTELVQDGRLHELAWVLVQLERATESEAAHA